MKKSIKIIIILIVLLLIVGVIYYAFREISPIDDTKSLYISCNSNNGKYEVISGTKILFAEKDSNCKLDLEVRNVDRNYIKIKSNIYLLTADGNNKINEGVTFNELYVDSNGKTIYYTRDQKTKFIFEYK